LVTERDIASEEVIDDKIRVEQLEMKWGNWDLVRRELSYRRLISDIDLTLLWIGLWRV
jgi:hypothetical protein